MINLDQKYESYVRNGDKKLRIDGIQERVRGYGYTDDGKDINGYYLQTDNYTLYYNCLLYTSPSPRDGLLSRMPSSA